MHDGSVVPVGVLGMGMFVPAQVVTAEDLAVETGIPGDVLREKFGIRQVHRAGPHCHVSEMAANAALAALQDVQVDPEDVDLLVSCGSEYKDHIVWSAATRVAHMTGCIRAQAFEVYALCAGMPTALRMVRDMMMAEEDLKTVLVVAASKESALVDKHNQRTRFMFNFGDGASAVVLRRGLARNRVLASAAMVDTSLSDAIVIPAGGSREPASEESVRSGRHYLDIPEFEAMKDRLDAVSGENFLRVIRTALHKSGRDHINFLTAVHMKRSMQAWLESELQPDRTIYLEDYGHMQAADQIIGLCEARERGLLHDGDTVVLAAAGVGYTWAATVLSWGD